MTREFKFRVMQFVAAYYDESTLCAGPIRVYNLSYGIKRISVYQLHRMYSVTLDADGSVTFNTNTDAKIVAKAIVADLRNFDEDLYKECSIKDEQYFKELVNNSGESDMDWFSNDGLEILKETVKVRTALEATNEALKNGLNFMKQLRKKY